MTIGNDELTSIYAHWRYLSKLGESANVSNAPLKGGNLVRFAHIHNVYIDIVHTHQRQPAQRRTTTASSKPTPNSWQIDCI